MKHILLLMLNSFSTALYPQNVTIPDSNFKAAIISFGVDKNNDGEIQLEEAKATEYLSVSKKNISDLSGIEAFENIRTLFCDGNNLTRLNLSKNARLSGLLCKANQISELDLSQNPALTRINCDSNKLSKLNFKSNPLLWEITCNNNQLTSLEFLGTVFPFKITCSYNNLKELDFASTTNLVTLQCTHNYISKLDVLKQNRLIELDCSNNVLSTLNVSNNHFLSSIKTLNNPGLQNIVINTDQARKSDSDKLIWQKDNATNLKVDKTVEIPKQFYDSNCY